MHIRLLRSLLLFSVCAGSVGDMHWARADRFVAPRFATTEQLHHLRPQGRGKCWMMIGRCRAWKHYVGFVDEAEWVYDQHGVGESENACLARAEINWVLCKNMKTQPVMMLFLETAATSSYPSEDVVGEAHGRVENSFAIVYSAVFGRDLSGGTYDPLPETVQQSVDTEYWLFTDETWPINRPRDKDALHFLDNWLPIQHHVNYETPRKSAKWFKVFPDKAVISPTADYVIWVDGSINVNSEQFVEYMIDQAGDTMAVFRHPQRSCIYKEAEISAPMKKYSHEPLMDQVNHYREQGWPENAGMIAGTVICWNTKHINPEFNEAWWDEIERWSLQDQLSFPVVAAKFNLTYQICSDALWDNEWFVHNNAHRKHEYNLDQDKKEVQSLVGEPNNGKE